jgi:hypothetical protein
MEAEANIADEGFLVAYEWHAYLSPTSTACDGRSPISSPDWHEQPALQYSRYSKYVQSGREQQASSALTFQAAVASASTPATVYVAGGSSSVFCSAGFSDKLEVLTTSSSAAAPAAAASAAPPARLSVARCGLAAASTGGGKVLLFAGGNSAGGYVDTVDVFLASSGGGRVHPATVTVTETETMTETESEQARTARTVSTPIRMTQTTLALSEKRSWLEGGSGEAFAFFVGGATENPFSVSSAVDVYDAALRT